MVVQSDLAFFGRSGGEKPRKMRKRKVRGYIYLMKWGRVSKNTEKCEKTKSAGFYIYVINWGTLGTSVSRNPNFKSWSELGYKIH